MIKLVSFDVWDTLFSIQAFFKQIAKELAQTTDESSETLEHTLITGYETLRTQRRLGVFEDSRIVAMMLSRISGILGVDTIRIDEAISGAVKQILPVEYVLEGTCETLKIVKKLGLQVITLGNVVFWPGEHNRTLVKKAKLSQYIDAQFYADELGSRKPKQEMFITALAKFRIEPKEAVHVGDNLVEDFAGAVFSGMGAVLIDKNVKEPVRLSSWNAYLIPDLQSLEAVLREPR